MACTERENPPDDLEVEITDLDPTLKRRLMPHLRRWGLALTAVLVLLVIGIILASVVNVRGLLADGLFKPDPTAVSSNLSVYLQGNPSWGQFTVDGKPLPLAEHNTPLMLTPGLHRITWQAAPFRPQNCVVTVVDAFTITGPCLLSGNISLGHGSSSSILTLSFFASLNDLSSDQRAALISQVQTVVARYTISETVRPGEVYAISEQKIEANPSLCALVAHLAFCYTRANQPLLATLHLQLDTSTSPDDPCITSGQCMVNQQDCRLFCADPLLSFPGQFIAAKGWDIAVPVQLLWSYNALSGQVIARDQPDSALRTGQEYQTVSLHIDQEKQGWLVVPSSSETEAGTNDLFCHQSGLDTQVLLSGSSNGQDIYVQQSFYTAADCLEIAISPVFEGSATPTPTTNAPPKAIFLNRFGVILAVNEVALHLLPHLPVADTYEKSMAQRLLATPPASST